ncbi:hypothetical protein JMJ77_0007070 [Colletotrichum scovillei]|uniref:Uncharacterized protein n=1 Tax=Colletotrichum scovillei TaxID=1209932 RepID=A0A9P7UII8_9PEZI|nr:hypothetical protein JMJ77_0007070 [Colletotrichum scovillei]KAG7074000.1 hypothetical protein JMJ76_0010490 [Colletotrichum scovillei]KAG7081154.1 hypothetical protein JMJ78_0003282 [Colletotrichum scovillei]
MAVEGLVPDAEARVEDAERDATAKQKPRSEAKAGRAFRGEPIWPPSPLPASTRVFIGETTQTHAIESHYDSKRTYNTSSEGRNSAAFDMRSLLIGGNS